MSLLRVYMEDELGRDGYPPEWHREIKHFIRADAGHRCERCGHPYAKGAGEWSPCDEQCRHMGELVKAGWKVSARWRILTVHHLTGDKADCRWWNLAALCQRCHLEIQGRVRMDRPYAGAHSEWFRLHAAGWYAWRYLGEELDRETAIARLDELLAFELQGEQMPIEVAT